MIFITIIKNKQKIASLEATGHSGYAESGKDIVCSAVSAITQTLILGLEKVLKLNVEKIIDESIPHLYVGLKNLSTEQINKAQTLMQTAVLGLKEVADGCKKYIKIKEIIND